MFMKYNRDYGITGSKFKVNYRIAYMNGSKIFMKNHYFPSNSTSIDEKKNIALKKVISEYIERFSLSIGGKSQTGVDINYGYNEVFGYIDTTGTAANYKTKDVLNKALSEIVEKNELLIFWYSNDGERYKLNYDSEKYNLIKNLNFNSDQFKSYILKNLSSWVTVITVGFFEGVLCTCGISCDRNINKAFYNSILEAKIVEWQNYKNPESKFYFNCNYENYRILEFLTKKEKNIQTIDSTFYDSICETTVLKLNENIEYPEIILLHNQQFPLKSVKLISKYFLNCIPTKLNIESSKNQGILNSYQFNYNDIDCILV